MQYTNYFGAAIREHGAPHLDMHQLQRMMNIVFIESSIATIEELNLSSPALFNKVCAKQTRLANLTKDLPPMDLLKELVNLSANN